MRLLLVAPACDGTDVGEAWVAFQWARLFAENHDLTVLTMRRDGHLSLSRQLPGAEVVEFPPSRLFSRFERFNSLAKPDYLVFHRAARQWVRAQQAAGRHFDVAHQPVPVAMRYPSPITGTGIPLVLGPVGGGLTDPPGFAVGEDTAPWYTKLRRIDGLRLRHDPVLRRTYEEAALVLGIAPYVGEALDSLRLRRFEVMSETAVDDLAPAVDRSGRTAPLRLLFVGRLIRTKGARDAVRALSLLDGTEVHLDLVGEGPDRGPCEELADELGVGGRVTFHGWQDRDAVAGFYDRADVFVFPSYREPGGNVIFEAMAHGLPVITVDRGGPGVAADASCGVVVPATSPEQLARDVAGGITRMSDPEVRRRLGQGALERVRQVGLWPAKRDRMEQLLNEVRSPGRS